MSPVISEVRADGVVHHEKLTGVAFGKAVVEYFNLPAGKVSCEVEMHTRPDDVFGVSLRICLNAEDLAAIARKMGAA
jgi:hypothetical protein